MKKYNLNLNDLHVNSFETSNANKETGTVKGNAEKTYVGCTGYSLDPECTEVTCDNAVNTCGPTRDDGCTQYMTCQECTEIYPCR
ncbi:MAG: pinensin family lanthipeptide [Rhodothermaceae bacterium]